jgi:hypothetical protein
VLPVRRPVSSLFAKILLPAKLAQPPPQPHPAFVGARPDAGPFACDPTSLIIGTPAFQIHSQDFWGKKKKKKKKKEKVYTKPNATCITERKPHMTLFYFINFSS